MVRRSSRVWISERVARRPRQLEGGHGFEIDLELAELPDEAELLGDGGEGGADGLVFNGGLDVGLLAPGEEFVDGIGGGDAHAGLFFDGFEDGGEHVVDGEGDGFVESLVDESGGGVGGFQLGRGEGGEEDEEEGEEGEEERGGGGEGGRGRLGGGRVRSWGRMVLGY